MGCYILAGKQTELQKCGIVMPISDCDGCDEGHWREVKTLIERAATIAGFKGVLVSEADDVGVIQKRIVQNLYDCPVIVCDISGRNANVMFELGMRLAFDKPTIIIKDDRTPFSFDTSPVEHVNYPRDLRYTKVEEFQTVLSGKISKSAASSGDDSFLKSFGSFKVADIPVEKASIDELILDELAVMKAEIRTMRNSNSLGHRDNITGRGFEDKWVSANSFINRSYKSMSYRLSSELDANRLRDVQIAVKKLKILKGVKQAKVNWSDHEKEVFVEFADSSSTLRAQAEHGIIEILGSYM